jgi:hypothetical protein
MANPEEFFKASCEIGQDLARTPAGERLFSEASSEVAGTGIGKALMRMAKGNHTVEAILKELAPSAAEKSDSLLSPGFDPIAILKKNRIYGSRIQTLHQEVAGGSTETMKDILQARQFGLLNKKDLIGAIDHTGPELDASGISEKVKGARVDQILRREALGHLMATMLDENPADAVNLAARSPEKFRQIDTAYERTVAASAAAGRAAEPITEEVAAAAENLRGRGTFGRIMGDTRHSPAYNLARLFATGPRDGSYRSMTEFYGS